MMGLKTMWAVIFLCGSFFSNISAQGRFVDVVEEATYIVSIKTFDNLRNIGSGIYFQQDVRNLIMTVSHIIRIVEYTSDKFSVI